MVLAREGDKVEVAPGVIKTISSFGLSYGGDGRADIGNGEDGKAIMLNSAGVLAFSAIFTDNSHAILTTRVPVAGDATFDGIVDVNDFNILWQNFGKAGDRGAGDFNSDGVVNFADFQLLEKNFGRVPPQSGPMLAHTPEPGTAMLLGAAFALLARRRPRSRV
jgi:hypothetical protein